MSLTREQIEQIEARAEDIVKSAYQGQKNKPPIELDLVLKDNGLQVFQINFDDEQIAGAYDKSTKRIFVAENDYFPRQLFTIAHELGHFFLHEKKEQEVFWRKDALKVGEKNERPVEETEADWFAASMLMPRELVKNYWFLLKDSARLADLFAVSESALRWRLINLGLLHYDHE